MKSQAKEHQIIYQIITANEIFAKTQIFQSFLNDYSFPLEIKVVIPLLNSFNLTKFAIKLDNKIIVSKVLEKEKGKEKYTDKIASGNTAFLGNLTESGEKMEINIGNLLPGKIIEVMTEYIQLIQSEDMSYCLSVIQSYPKMVLNSVKDENTGHVFQQYSFHGIKCNIYISTINQLTRFILLNKRKDFTYNTKIFDSMTYAQVSFNSKDMDNTIINETIKHCKFKSLPYSPLKIIFRTENINKPLLFSQYNETKDETCYLLHYIFSEMEIQTPFSKIINDSENPENREKLENYNVYDYIDTNEDTNYYDVYGYKYNISSPSCYIFLLDQSGSMNGHPIKVLKQTIQLFIKSLPFNSFFQIIGFGTKFIKYNDCPLLYDEKNIKEIMNKISIIKADLGGTNLFNPLQDIFKNKELYTKLNLPINLIIITDGKVMNAGSCAYIIYENRELFKTHAIGIGDDYDRALIEQCAYSGRGIKAFVKNINNMYYPIFKILNITSRNYLKDVNIDIKNKSNFFKDIKYDIIPSNNLYQDDIIIKGFICPGKPINIKKDDSIQVNINWKNNYDNNLLTKENNINIIENLDNGDELSKIIIGNLINNKRLNKNLTDKEIIDLSKKYGVLSNLTCFFGSIENEEKIENQLLNISNIYVSDNTETNFSYPKTGKHGRAKIIRLNMEEEDLYNLLVNNQDENIYQNLGIDINSNDNKIVSDLIMKQNIEKGYWEKIFFDYDKYKDLYQKILNYYKNKEIKKEEYELICMTLLTIYYLEEKFKSYELIWKQIVNKGKYFLSKNKINYDIDINAINSL